MRRLEPAWTWTGPDIPASKPAHRSLRVERDGRTWVRLYTAGEPLPADEWSEPHPGPNPPVQRTTWEPTLCDVFAADGRYLGRVRPPAKATVREAPGNTARGIDRDAADGAYTVGFRIEPALPRRCRRKICDLLLSGESPRLDSSGVDIASAPARRSN